MNNGRWQRHSLGDRNGGQLDQGACRPSSGSKPAGRGRCPRPKALSTEAGGFLVKRGPVIGGVIIGGITIAQVKQALAEGRTEKAWNEGITGGAQAIIVGVGGGLAGDVVRQALHEESVYLGGGNEAPEESGLWKMAKSAWNYVAPRKTETPPAPAQKPKTDKGEGLNIALDGPFNASSPRPAATSQAPAPAAPATATAAATPGVSVRKPT